MLRCTIFLFAFLLSISIGYSQELVSDTVIFSVGNGRYDTIIIKDRIAGQKLQIRSKYTTDSVSIDKPLPIDNIINLSDLNAATAPPKSWKFDFEGGLTGSQQYLANWSAGGESSVSGRLFINTGGNFKRKRSMLNYRFRCALGYQWRPELGNDQKKLRKTDDKLEFDCNYGYRIRSNFYYSFFVNFLSQFADGYNESYTSIVSKFMAPGYLKYGIGFEYDYKSMVVVNMSPISIRHTFVLDSLISSLHNYGLKDGEKMRTDLGANVSIAFKKAFSKTVDMATKVILFSDYLDNPQNIDINFEIGLNFRITKVFSTGIYFNYIYDDNVLFDIDGRLVPRSQFKESFFIGVVYKI